jgi:hypothetical protein
LKVIIAGVEQFAERVAKDAIVINNQDINGHWGLALS